MRAAAALSTAAVVPLALIAHDRATRPGLLRPTVPRLDGHAAYAAGVVIDVLLWCALLETARVRHRPTRVAARALIAFVAAFGVGGQAFFYRVSFDYVDSRSILFALTARDVVVDYVRAELGSFLVHLAVPAACVLAVAEIRRRLHGAPERSWPAPVAATVALAAALVYPFPKLFSQPVVPELLLLHALPAPVLSLAGLARRPRTLPSGRHRAAAAIAPVDTGAPSIVLVLGESVRRDEMCSARDAGCTKSPELDRAAPDRVGYGRAASVASCTEIASVALWSGLAPNALPGEIAEAPLLFDYAKARGYRTAYLSSQNLAFQRFDAFLRTSRIDLLREARHREQQPDVASGSPDELTLAEAVSFVAAGGAPAFVVAHLSNTHAPYRQDPRHLAHTHGRVVRDEPKNARARYDNALDLQDAQLGDFLRALRATEAGRRAIVLYVSDHGESFGAHGGMGHAHDLYEDAIDVPLFVDAPRGSLPDATLERMRAEAGTRPVYTVDVSATVVDLLGGLDAPAWQRDVAALAGASLLRPAPDHHVVLLSLCPLYRECPHLAFGAVDWPLKLHFVASANRSLCFDVDADPDEAVPLPRARCDALRRDVDAGFRGRRARPAAERRASGAD